MGQGGAQGQPAWPILPTAAGETPRPGELVVARNRKWDGTGHWVVPGFHVGEDEYGWWVYQGRGEFISRPGAALHTRSDAVLLIPRAGGFAATFYDESNPGDFRVYVDLAWDLSWHRIGEPAGPAHPGVVEFHMVDMDLDVIRSARRGVFVDDEDEFAEHAASMAYPGELMDAVRAECGRLEAAVLAGTGPFNGVSDAWMALGRKEHT
ncbi:DUF402 domain-containing protein [Sinomonas notoginsengisoli]|uniref:DUF402 domain-containing protein n=1 Tax=Sinomonas notoginsengisoli TaxID=1457311 RepID=UPI001F4781D0|nr:DUF402 domain-containing protein [Sinomonas notoginsengisoli]